MARAAQHVNLADKQDPYDLSYLNLDNSHHHHDANYHLKNASVVAVGGVGLSRRTGAEHRCLSLSRSNSRVRGKHWR